jgi:hypothetical protein
MGQTPITNPVFRIGTYEGVYAPTWEDKTWQGTIAPGARVKVSLPIELAPRQHGEFKYRVMYDGRVVDEVGLKVGRPWGVYLFGALLIVVAPMTVWRLCVALVRAVRDSRKDRAAERGREVGLPGTSALRSGGAEAGEDAKRRGRSRGKPSGKSAAANGDSAPAEGPTAGSGGGSAVGPVPEPALAPQGATPMRRVEETMVVGAPLFAGPAPSRGGSEAEQRTGGEAEVERTKVLPAQHPVRPAPTGGDGLVRPSDVAGELAWNAGEERDES